MSDWSELMRGLAPREDLHADFPAANFDQDQPIWLSREDVLNGAIIAARVMEIIAARGGSRVGSSVFRTLRKTVENGVDDSARHLCDDEARRVLRWLEAAEPASDSVEEGPPEVDVMYASDLKSRASVAAFAIDEGYDLEMEYFDDARETWPRIRCTPLAVRYENDEDEELALRFEGRHGDQEVPLRQVRWLMPVTRRELPDDADKKEPGEVIRFPAGRSDDE